MRRLLMAVVSRVSRRPRGGRRDLAQGRSLDHDEEARRHEGLRTPSSRRWTGCSCRSRSPRSTSTKTAAAKAHAAAADARADAEPHETPDARRSGEAEERPRAVVVLTDDSVAHGIGDEGGEAKQGRRRRGPGRRREHVRDARQGRLLVLRVRHQQRRVGAVSGVSVTIEVVGKDGKTFSSAYAQVAKDSLAPGREIHLHGERVARGRGRVVPLHAALAGPRSPSRRRTRRRRPPRGGAKREGRGRRRADAGPDPAAGPHTRADPALRTSRRRRRTRRSATRRTAAFLPPPDDRDSDGPTPPST